MTDRDLLERAAKAAGIRIDGAVENMIAQPDHRKGGFIIRNDRGGNSCWNPLTDDGDALRLAVKLEIEIRCPGAIVSAAGPHAKYCVNEKIGSDPYAATRRAIVRAAAEIGAQNGN